MEKIWKILAASVPPLIYCITARDGTLEQFVVIMYGHTSTNCKVGEAGFDLFARSR